MNYQPFITNIEIHLTARILQNVIRYVRKYLNFVHIWLQNQTEPQLRAGTQAHFDIIDSYM